MLCFCASTVGAYFLYICSVQVHLRFLFKLFTVVAVIGQSINHRIANHWHILKEIVGNETL